MQILIAGALTAVAAIQTSALAARVTRSAPVLVRSVIDGDTIDVATVGRVRLLGIDAPEVGHGFDTSAPFGREARERLTQLVLHRWVRLEQERSTRDVYSRHLAYVLTEDGVCVNAALVRDGLARVSARVPLTRLPELQRAEADARAFRRGMWGTAPSIPAPSYTRRSKASRPPTSRSTTPASKRRKTRTKKP
ncbi:MAG TPA: thermonuclease family protein [Vicinamibacterales bacterium]|nr:thermonuclease family protein [Vicinamibacterales bacterium]